MDIDLEHRTPHTLDELLDPVSEKKLTGCFLRNQRAFLCWADEHRALRGNTLPEPGELRIFHSRSSIPTGYSVVCYGSSRGIFVHKFHEWQEREIASWSQPSRRSVPRVAPRIAVNREKTHTLRSKLTPEQVAEIDTGFFPSRPVRIFMGEAGPEVWSVDLDPPKGTLQVARGQTWEELEESFSNTMIQVMNLLEPFRVFFSRLLKITGTLQDLCQGLETTLEAQGLANAPANDETPEDEAERARRAL